MHYHVQRLLTAAALLAGCFCSSTSRADIMNIASYDFFGGSPTSSAPTTWGSPITFGSGIVDGSPTPMLNPANHRLEVGSEDTTATGSGTPPVPSPSTFNGYITAGINGNQYVSFNVAIPSNATVDLTSLNFDYEMINPSASFSMGVYSSATGFAPADFLEDYFQPTINSGTISYNGESIDLSGNPAFQDLTDTTLEFRFYMSDNSNGTRFHVFDNISLIGDVALTNNVVPEPGSIAIWSLAGAAMAGFGIWRRRAR